MCRVTSDECGVAALEFAISATVLILLSLLMYDVGMALAVYSYLDSDVREAVRSGSGTAELEASSTPYEDLHSSATLAQHNSCVNSGFSSGFPCGHYLVQHRLNTLWLLHSNGLPVTDLKIETQYQASGAGVRDDTVWARISTEFNGLLIRGLRIGSRMSGPYLYNSE
jgi:hypothetical protein